MSQQTRGKRTKAKGWESRKSQSENTWNSWCKRTSHATWVQSCRHCQKKRKSFVSTSQIIDQTTQHVFIIIFRFLTKLQKRENQLNKEINDMRVNLDVMHMKADREAKKGKVEMRHPKAGTVFGKKSNITRLLTDNPNKVKKLSHMPISSLIYQCIHSIAWELYRALQGSSQIFCKQPEDLQGDGKLEIISYLFRATINGPQTLLSL